jgi:NADH dehydrogenase
MSTGKLHVVTGGLGYSGRCIAQRLIEAGCEVRTITNSPHRPNPFGDRLEVRPMPFDDPAALAESLRGADVLYNTYWVRFNHRTFNHDRAVENTRRLFEAARRAGVRRVVHTSITNPAEDSPLEYFRGKAVLERELRGSGLSWAILRPTVLFGRGDILINNIAWMLRRFPVFGLFGDGRYRIRPVCVDDFAAQAVAAGAGQESFVANAVGPESFTFRELVATIGRIIGRPRRLVPIPPRLGWWIGTAVGAVVGDVVVTREEITGLMAGLLDVEGPPTGSTRLTDWARENAATLGARYAHEISRRRPADPTPRGALTGAGPTGPDPA